MFGSRSPSYRAKKPNEIFELVRTVVIAMAIALTFRTFVYDPFVIPSQSMVPTLLVGDYLFVSKFSYGYSKHTVAGGYSVFEGRIPEGGPERGDVVVFRLPSDTSQDFIKRVVGLPGDRIRVNNGILVINGVPVDRRRIEDYALVNPHNRAARSLVPRYVEILPGGREHVIIETQGDGGAMDTVGEVAVPAGHYFVMGDNRDNSVDSRRPSVGFVPEENLVGRAEILWHSLEGDAQFWQVWRWFTDTRTERLFTRIE